MNENFEDLKGYENNYQISNLGNIRSKKSLKVLKFYIHYKEGYKMIELSKNGVSKKHTIHRLLALQFIDNPNNKGCVNHKDGNRLNNSLDNLEWTTNSENIKHGFIRRNGFIKKSNKITLEKIKQLKAKSILENLDLYTLIINHFDSLK